MEKIFYLAQVFGVLNTIGHVFFVVSVVLLVLLVFAICTLDVCNEKQQAENIKYAKKAYKIAAIFLALGFLLTCFVPSKETYLFMVGGKVVDSAIEQNPSVKDLPGNTLQLLNEYIVSKTEGIRNKE